MILRKHRLWHLLEPDFHPLPEREDVGRALSLEEANRLLEAAANSRSRSLFPALMLYLHTGVRAAEGRLRWKQIDFKQRAIRVGRSKTRGGEGRVIPLNDEAFDILMEWHARFADPHPDHFVFPSERYGFDGEDGPLVRGSIGMGIGPDKAHGLDEECLDHMSQGRRACGADYMTYDTRSFQHWRKPEFLNRP